ncbi:Di-copper centre-containing protein [Aaosphaeria arxii CBS 175.79]|uniref:Di-copper centre-containing protein n=1 Tax=Aaosphaeria arxii CBS 175.79 TaxID=1450172 RepID=A0A6A5XYI7_9PLEO|nr:Di-copper centre-containing protein [Aaosphaeria arxii CBS 175.79]KAF2018019.1 Di-copper centre-containing protein [Aaosphaeria arxii CBS 175.79]
MRSSFLAAAALISCTFAKTFEYDILADQGFANLKLHVSQKGFPSPETCTWENVAKRREWSRLTRAEKLDYIGAVQCLGRLPARTPASVAAGARSRYDDLVVTHILQTYYTHGNGNFLSWHRYYMWTYEQMLRNECGYKGYLPYYNWAWWAEDPASSPLLDGSDTSISGDGEFVPGRNATCVPNPKSCYQIMVPGTGGGCVTSGPFKDWKVNLGPITSRDTTVPPNPSPDGLGHNPRCIKRDLSVQSALEARDEYITDLIKDSANISAFQDTFQNPNYERLSVHLGGHNIISGDAGSDFFNSPSDPFFWFHHASVDRTWWIWQNQDIDSRRFTIAGTLTFMNNPPTRNATLDDIMTMGEFVGGSNITVANASSTLAGPFCYVYE